MKKLTQLRALKLMLICSAVTASATLIWRGITLPWSEEGAIFALYGVCVGLCIGIALNMIMMKLFNKSSRR